MEVAVATSDDVVRYMRFDPAHAQHQPPCASPCLAHSNTHVANVMHNLGSSVSAACLLPGGLLAVGTADGSVALLQADASPDACVLARGACHVGAVSDVIVTFDARVKQGTQGERPCDRAMVWREPDVAFEMVTLGADGIVMCLAIRRCSVRAGLML